MRHPGTLIDLIIACFRFEESGVKDRMWANWTYVGEETFWEEEIEPIDEVVSSFPAFILVAGILLSLAFVLMEKAAAKGGSASAAAGARIEIRSGSRRSSTKTFAP